MFLFKKNSGFTLIEILLYFGLFSLIIAVVYPIFIEILRSYVVLRGDIDLNSEIRNIFLRIQKEVMISKSIEILTKWEIVFNQKNEKIAIFLTKPVYLDSSSSSIKGYANNLTIGSIGFSGSNYNVNYISSSSCWINSTTNINNSIYAFSGYAWSPNIGWIKFRNNSGEVVFGVCLDSNYQLRGFAWNDVIGWISFNCLDLNLCGTSDYKVQIKNNYLFGYAWNDVVGWLIFDGPGGKVYLGKMNPYIYYLDLISDPKVFVEDLVFTKINESLKVNVKIKSQGGFYEEGETAIVVPFK